LDFTTAVDVTVATSFKIAGVANSSLEFDAAVGTTTIHPTITFLGDDTGPGTLVLDSRSNFHGVVAGFDEGESIVVPGATSASLDSTGKIITVFNSSNTIGTINLATSYAGATFNVSSGGVITLIESPDLTLGGTAVTVVGGGSVTLPSIIATKIDADD